MTLHVHITLDQESVAGLHRACPSAALDKKVSFVLNLN